MNHTAKEIIDYLGDNYPQDNGVINICNIAYHNREVGKKIAYQYLLDVSHNDPMTNGISHYESNIKSELRELETFVKTLPWPFYGYEVDEAKAVMQQVAEGLNILNLDVEKSFIQLNIKPDETVYYIVVTVVEYNIPYIG